MVESRQRCPNSSRIRTCFQILVEFGHSRNSDGQIPFYHIYVFSKFSTGISEFGQ
jgi:hypothetical protein